MPPERVVTNDEICERIDSTDEWIYSRTGIKTRRFAESTDTVTGLAIEAGRAAMAQAGLDGAGVGAVIVATSTNFRQTPSCAPSVAVALGRAASPRSTWPPAARASATRWGWRPTCCAAGPSTPPW